MALLSIKNSMVPGGAATSLGIGAGDQLSQQLKDTEEELKKKKKLLDEQRKTYPDFGPGTSQLFGIGIGGM